MKRHLSNALITLLFFIVIVAGFCLLRHENQSLVNEVVEFKLQKYEDTVMDDEYDYGKCFKCRMTIHKDFFLEHVENCKGR